MHVHSLKKPQRCELNNDQQFNIIAIQLSSKFMCNILTIFAYDTGERIG